METPLSSTKHFWKSPLLLLFLKINIFYLFHLYIRFIKINCTLLLLVFLPVEINENKTVYAYAYKVCHEKIGNTDDNRIRSVFDSVFQKSCQLARFALLGHRFFPLSFNCIQASLHFWIPVAHYKWLPETGQRVSDAMTYFPLGVGRSLAPLAITSLSLSHHGSFLSEVMRWCHAVHDVVRWPCLLQDKAWVRSNFSPQTHSASCNLIRIASQNWCLFRS